MPFEMYSVGEKYQKWQRNSVFTQIEFDGERMLFIYGIPDPTPLEIQTAIENTLTITFGVFSNIPFILLHLDKLGWMDAPFYPNPYPDNYFDPQFKEGEGIPFTVFVVDSSTGELKGIRVMGLSNICSHRLFDTCRTLKKLPEKSDTEQARTIQKVYAKYPSSAAMVKDTEPLNSTSFIKQ